MGIDVRDCVVVYGDSGQLLVPGGWRLPYRVLGALVEMSRTA
jgi:hypothetical protein